MWKSMGEVKRPAGYGVAFGVVGVMAFGAIPFKNQIDGLPWFWKVVVWVALYGLWYILVPTIFRLIRANGGRLSKMIFKEPKD